MDAFQQTGSATTYSLQEQDRGKPNYVTDSAAGGTAYATLNQFGALFEPLMIALILAHRGDYRLAFGTLLVPAILTLILLSIARFSIHGRETWRWSRVKSRLRACPGVLDLPRSSCTGVGRFCRLPADLLPFSAGRDYENEFDPVF
jgi:hypothetical protein